MRELDRYAFAARWYVVIPQVLAAGEVTRRRRVLDDRMVRGGPSVDDQRFGWHGQLLGWDQGFRDLIDHPVVLDALSVFIGPQVRLDNVYGIAMEPGSDGLGLHGPEAPYDPAQFFWHQAGHTRTGLLGFAWALNDTPDAGGGFGCIPGSHQLSGPPPQGAEALVEPVDQPAGSLLIFTEALWHCTMPWNGHQRRLSLIYKYAPGAIQFDAVPPIDEDSRHLLTSRQQRLVQAPSRIARPDALE